LPRKIESDGMERHLLDAGVPQGLPVSPTHFAIYTIGLIEKVEQKITDSEGLSLVANHSWVANGTHVNEVVTKLD
jgi:hypothetical protein